MLTLTPKAASQIHKLGCEPQSQGKPLRLLVEQGGCSGMKYGMAFDKLQPDDTIIETDGIRLVISPQSLPYLKGAEIDFDDSLMGKGFNFHNPNAQSTCSCGRSFR